MLHGARRGGDDNLQRVFVLGASALNFRNDLALVGNASTQLPVTPMTSVSRTQSFHYDYTCLCCLSTVPELLIPSSLHTLRSM